MTRLALASVPLVSRLPDGVAAAVRAIETAARQDADIVCLPESCLPGHRLQPATVPAYPAAELDAALARVAAAARRHRIAVVVGTEQVTDAGVRLTAAVVDRTGAILGHQVKNQLTVAEEAHYVHGRGRAVFTVAGLTIGIVICHEGFAYPETVRWAARAGAQVVFHPHYEGDNDGTGVPGPWPGSFHEQAVRCRAVENTVYLASCNYALRNQPSATCVVDPRGELVARLDPGTEGVLVCDIDPARATRELALRLADA